MKGVKGLKSIIPFIAFLLMAICNVAAFGAPQAEPGQDLLSHPSMDGEPTKVFIGLFVNDITGIDNKDESFTADFVLRLRWHDPRLVLPEGEGTASNRTVDFERIWHPVVQVLNEKGLKRRLCGHFVDGEGWVNHSQRFYGELRTPMNFRDFPWDKQSLVIDVLALHDAGEVELVLEEKVSESSAEFSISDWDFSEGHSSIQPWTDGPKAVQFFLCRFTCTAKRQTVFFFLKVFLTVTLIFLMAWAEFSIDHSHVAPQIGISTSSVFTLIAFQFTLGFLLPQIPYVTRLDRFLAGVTILVFIALGEAIVTTRFVARDRKDLALKIDRWGRWLFLLAYGMVVLITLI